jgi:hypothetical protein
MREQTTPIPRPVDIVRNDILRVEAMGLTMTASPEIPIAKRVRRDRVDQRVQSEAQNYLSKGIAKTGRHWGKTKPDKHIAGFTREKDTLPNYNISSDTIEHAGSPRTKRQEPVHIETAYASEHNAG